MAYKVIIFDLDGTLYSQKSALFEQISKRTRRLFRSKIEEFDDAKYFSLQKQYPCVYDGLRSVGIPLDRYETAVFESLNYNDLNLNTDVIDLLDSDSMKYVLSLAPEKHIKSVTECLGLSDHFVKMYSLIDTNCSKYILYENLRESLNLNRNQILVVGDNYLVDLKEAKENGYHTLLITS